MKKSKIITMTAILGSVMLIASVVAFAASGSGYQYYKSAIKALTYLENATINAQIELKDNDEIILSGKTTQMVDNNSVATYSNSSFILDGQTHTSEVSMVDGKIISVTDGEYISYNLMGQENIRMDEFKVDENSSTMRLAELILDTLVGDVKNQFIKDRNTVSVNMEGAQIPELARLGISAILENMNQMSEKNSINDDLANTLFDKIPQFDMIDVKSLSMKADIEDNLIKTNDFNVIVGGTDKYGESHVIEINLNVQISDVGNTVVKTIDTTGIVVRDAGFGMERIPKDIVSEEMHVQIIE